MENNHEQEVKEIDIIKSYIGEYLSRFTNYYNPNKEKKILCRNPEHQERRPSMSFDTKHSSLHCFSCNVSYSIIDLVIMDYNIGDLNKPLQDRLKAKENIKEAINKIKELFNMGNDPLVKASEYVSNPKQPQKPTIFNDMYKKAVFGNPLKEYMEERGISEQILKMFGLRNNNEGIIIPYQIEGDLTQYTSRIIPSECNIKQNDAPRYKHHGSLTVYDPFNYLQVNKERIVFVTEGEIDALSIYEGLKEIPQDKKSSCACGAIALGGISNTRELYKRLDMIEDKTKLYLLFYRDNDNPGIKGLQDIELALNNKSINYAIVNPRENYKDANEQLVGDRRAFIEDLIKYTSNAKNLVKRQIEAYNEALRIETEKKQQKYISENSILGYFNQFEAHVQTPVRPMQTYFNKFDKLINGGIREGLITIGALSSLGKTSFILQLVDQIAQSRQRDILFFSLEMSKDELIAKSLSRLMYICCEDKIQNTKSYSDILNPIAWNSEEQELYKKAVTAYKSYAKNVYIHEGVGTFGVKEIELIANNHIENTGRAPLIVIDYLQILSTSDPRLNDKQKTDVDIVELKRLSRKLHIPIIAISSLNRASYGGDVSLESFKESGAIEYTSDLILGLNYQLTNDQLEELIKLKESKKQLPDKEKERAISDFYRKIKSSNPRKIRLDVLKNRSGENNVSIDFLFYPDKNIFVEANGSITGFKDLLEYSTKTTGNEEYIQLPF